jgi:segregation and condensation protein A
MYRIKLNNFEGPFDLLLFFIKRDELDIYDIPIAKITKEFLDYVHLMQMLDLEVASEFIVMAATLMQIKVRMLLPKSPLAEEEEEDPRAELVRRLLEYKRYKEAAEEFYGMETEQRKIYYREFFKANPVVHAPEENGLLRDVTLFHLIAAFKHAVENMSKQTLHSVQRINVSVEEQSAYIMNYLQERNRCTFLELVMDMTEKIRVIVTFLSLLELMKNHYLTVRLSDSMNNFWIHKR